MLRIKQISIILFAFLLMGVFSASITCADETTYEIRHKFSERYGFSWYDAADDTKEEFMERYNKELKSIAKAERLKQRAKLKKEKSRKRQKLAKKKVRLKKKKLAEKQEKKESKAKNKERKRHKDKLKQLMKKWKQKRKSSRK